MSIKFVSAEFLDTENAGRVRKCRELAMEADRLAADASAPEARTDYLELKRQWESLANEIERADPERQQTAFHSLG